MNQKKYEAVSAQVPMTADVAVLAKFAEEISVSLNTGQIFVRFNAPPGDHQLVISYEYSLECQPPEFGQ